MEKFKTIEEMFLMDEKHRLLGEVSGFVPDLKKMHEFLLSESLNDEVPDDIKGQFNVVKNMALYTYFFYALAPEVHLKTYTLIEYALKIKVNSDKRIVFRDLLKMAVEKGWVSDAGFRHIDNPGADNEWSKSLESALRTLRNALAHGEPMLDGDCIHHVRVCADFINQLFPKRDDT